jgi:hypothetical protein
MCTLDLMAGTDAVMQGDVLRSVIRAAPVREADDELYDLACDLVEAAAASRSDPRRRARCGGAG